MKKFLYALGILALTLVMTASAPARAAGPIEINYWGLFTGGDGDFMKDMIAQYNESQSEIQVKYMSLIYDEYYMKLRTAAATGRGPDMAISHLTNLASLDNEGVLAPFDEAAEKAGLDWSKFNQNILSQSILNGKHMAVPLDAFAFVFFYNKKILADAGLLGPDEKPIIEPGEEGFMTFLRTLKEKVPADTGVFVTYMDPSTSHRLFMTLFAQLDGKMISDDGTKAAFNEGGKAKKVIEFMRQMVDEDLWPRGSLLSAEVFKSGKAAIHTMGVWATGEFERTPGLEFGVIPMPRVFDKAATWGDSHTFILLKQRRPNPEKEVAVAKFCDWMTDNGAYWSRAGHIPSKTAVAESQAFKDLPYRSDYAGAVDTAMFLPQNKHIEPVNTIMMTNLAACMLGQQSVDETCEKMEAQVNRQLARK